MVWTGERYHVLILGSNRVGKTAFLQQLVHSSFKEEVDVQLEKMEETITVKCGVDQKSYLVDVTDTAYQEDDITSILTEQLYSVSNGCVLMYSVADRDSFTRVQLVYNHLLRVKGRSHWPCVLVGNKSDCISSFRQVPQKDGEALAEMLNLPFFEITCKSRSGVERSIHQLIREMRSPLPKDEEYKLDRKREKQASCVIC
jgi:small GTP-binding protein